MVALVITIIVLIILTTAVMITFNNGGMMDKANYAVYRSNIRSMQESFQMNTQNMMLENIGFSGSQINVHEKDNNFEEELEKAIPILKTLKNQNIKGRSYSQIVQIYGGKLYWSDTIENSTNTQDIEIQQILTELGIEAYNVEEPIYANSEYILNRETGDAWITGFDVPNENKGRTEITLPNRYTSDIDGNEYKITGITGYQNYSSYAIWEQLPNLEKVIIPKGYTYIGRFAFNSCDELKEIVLPNTVTIIRECVFAWSKKLEKINLPNGLLSIGQETFYNCYALNNIYLPDSITEMGKSVFYSCSSLTSINIPNNLQEIAQSTFSSCEALKEVQFGTAGNLKAISDYAFAGCTILGSLDNGVLTIPEGVTTINYGAFYSCISLRTVNLPSTLQNIDITAFYNCDSRLVINVNKKESECSETLKSNLSSMGFTVNYNQE